MKRCTYGCKRTATTVFKNGRACCSSSPNKCPAKRKTDALLKAGINPFQNRSHPRGMLGKVPHNKGKKLDELYDDKTIKRLRQAFIQSGQRNGGCCEDPQRETERRQKISQQMKKVGAGGYRRGSGIGKKGWYNNIWCDSSWELAFVIYCLEHNKNIQRNTTRFNYTYNNTTKKFLPDFVVDGKLYEVKGYWTEQNREKIKQCSEEIQIVDSSNITLYTDYVISKYGKDFIRLYGE